MDERMAIISPPDKQTVCRGRPDAELGNTASPQRAALCCPHDMKNELGDAYSKNGTGFTRKKTTHDAKLRSTLQAQLRSQAKVACCSEQGVTEARTVQYHSTEATDCPGDTPAHLVRGTARHRSDNLPAKKNCFYSPAKFAFKIHLDYNWTWPQDTLLDESSPGSTQMLSINLNFIAKPAMNLSMQTPGSTPDAFPNHPRYASEPLAPIKTAITCAEVAVTPGRFTTKPRRAVKHTAEILAAAGFLLRNVVTQSGRITAVTDTVLNSACPLCTLLNLLSKQRLGLFSDLFCCEYLVASIRLQETAKK
ncbi:hypothetical protein Bbelb_325670 [Branchiostoma belcheri]|nr:hypothetical protein Bbelb_325670 [Branchiostoma belcheri]